MPRLIAAGEAMIEKTCSLWLESAEYRCVLTSGVVGGDGEAGFRRLMDEAHRHGIIPGKVHLEFI